QVHAFFGANAADAEHGGDVDDADAADFHVGAGQLGAGAHDVAAVNQGDAGDVVGNEAVAALDEGEDALAFADAAFAADDGAGAEDVHHAADFGAARGEEHFEGEGGRVDEFHGDQRGDEDGDLGVFGGAEEEFVGFEIAGKDDAGDFVGEEIGVMGFALLGSEVAQERGLGLADDLQPF